MLKKICYVIIPLILLTVAALAQNTFDSLRVLLALHKHSDTVRLNLLNEFAYVIAPVEPEAGLRLADSAVSLALLLGLDSKTGLSYRNRGVNYYYLQNFLLAKQSLDSALAWYRNATDDAGIGSCNFALGLVHYKIGAYAAALTHQKKAGYFYRQAGDQVKEGNAYNSAGANALELSMYPEALEYFQMAISIYEKTKHATALGLATANVGLVHKLMGNFSKAEEYYRKTNSIYQAEDNAAGLANSFMKMGTLYDAKEQYDSALKYYRQAYGLYSNNDADEGLALTGANLGITFCSLLRYDSALHYLFRAEDALANHADKKNLAQVMSFLGSAISKAPDATLQAFKINPANRFKLAEQKLRQAITIAESIESGETQYFAWETLFHLYGRYQQFAQAFEAGQQTIRLKESIYLDEKRDEAIKRELNYEFEKRKAVFAATHQASLAHQKTRNRFLLWGLAIVILASAMLFISYKRRRDLEIKKSEAELKAHMADIEMKVMRLQMNPHFIFNTLNSISDYIRKNNAAEADSYLAKFAKVMRMTLEHSEHQEITLADDLTLLQNYMDLEAQRLQHKFTYEIKVDENIDAENMLVPPMILQPFVENSIWHGIAKKEGKGKILVCIKKEGNTLHCSVADDGPGLPVSDLGREEAKGQKKSLGIRITRARIELLNKLKGSQAGVKLLNQPNGQGTVAHLDLPLVAAF